VWGYSGKAITMTVPIGVDPALLGLSAAVENAGAGSMAGAAGAAAPEITAVQPPGADGASVAAAEGMNARGAATMGLMADLTTVRSLFADTIGINGVSYAGVDLINQATLAF
jgi:PE family